MLLSGDGMRCDTADVKRVELRVHTQMSEMESVLPVRELLRTAAAWGWKAVAVTDHDVVQVFPDAMKIAARLGVKVIYGMDGSMAQEDGKESIPYRISMLAKNKKGLLHLYELVTLSHRNVFHHQPHIPKRVFHELREGLLLGSAGAEGELVRVIAAAKSDDEILAITNFYDYLEIQSAENYVGLIADETFSCIQSEEDVRNIHRKIVEISKRTGKILVATGDVHYLNPEDAFCRRVLLNAAGKKDDDTQSSRFLRTTEEMLQNFSHLGKEAAYEAVIAGSNRIADLMDEIDPSYEKCLPQIPHAHDIIKSMSYDKAKELYGRNLPRIVQERLDQELAVILEHGYSSLYLLQQILVQKAHEDGHITCTSGSVGASLIAHLIGITEVNPLPPHWRCAKCQYSKFITDGSVASGFDLQANICPQCGEKLLGDGHDIPYAALVGFDGSRQPDIVMSYPDSYRSVAAENIEKVCDHVRVYRVGTIEAISYDEAATYIQNYIDTTDRIPVKISVQEMVEKCVGTKKAMGINDSAFIIVPEDAEPGFFLPLQDVKDQEGHTYRIPHFSYRNLTDHFLKLNLLRYFVLSLLEKLERGTGCILSNIPFDDPSAISLFQKADTVGISEFHSPKVRQMLQELQPRFFSELVKISAFSHGTGAWEGNAQKLISRGVCTLNEVAATRDDVMMYLIRKGIDPLRAFQIMESVRKGNGILPKTIKILQEKGVPSWYIQSCQKMGYMFPRAHVVDHVMSNYRLAYYKAHHPQEFYRAYIETMADASDLAVIKSGETAIKERLSIYTDTESFEESSNGKIELLELALEMCMRGHHLRPHFYDEDLKSF